MTRHDIVVVLSFFTALLGATPLGTPPKRIGFINFGSLSLASQSAANTCDYLVSFHSTIAPPSGGTITAYTETSKGCYWTAHSDAPWLLVTSPHFESSGPVMFRISPNSSGIPRSSTVTVAGRTSTVWQSATNVSQTLGVGVPGPTTSQAITVTISAPVAIPSAGNDITKWSHLNVFDFSQDGLVSDWKLWVSTANDTRTTPNSPFNQDITLRKAAAPVQISDLSYSGSGLTGPLEDRIGLHVFTHFSPADNDRSSVDYGGHYFDLIGNGPAYARYFESSSFVLKCAQNSLLIAGCGESFTLTPAQSGAQNAYVWVRQENLDATLTVSGGGGTPQTIALTTDTVEYEGVVAIQIHPSDTATTYTVSLTAAAAHAGAASAYLGITRAKLGGTSAGNVGDTVVSNTGTTGMPSHTYGARIKQLDPGIRIPSSTSSVTLAPGQSLQSAINTAAGGTDIHLPQGYVTTEHIVLPNRVENGWVRIVADGAPSLTFGKRANPIDYPGGPTSPAKIVTHTSDPAISCANNVNGNLRLSAAHHYAIVGLEVVADGQTGNTVNWGVIALGHGGGYGVPEPALDGSSQPHDIILSGVYVHRDSSLPNLINTVSFNVNASAIYDSYISGARGPDFSNENHAININDSTGPLTVKNNYLEAASTDLLVGGVPTLPIMQPKDIEVAGNFFDKATYFNSPDANNNYPKPLDIKNELEFKTGQYITITGNVFEHSMAGDHFSNGQTGQAIFVRNTNVGGSQPQDTGHILIENNIIRYCATGIQFEAYDLTGIGDPGDLTVTGLSKVPRVFVTRNFDLMIRNNSLENLSFTQWGLLGRGYYGSSAIFTFNAIPLNLTIDHNTGNFDWAHDLPYITIGHPLAPTVSVNSDLSTLGQLDAINLNARQGYPVGTVPPGPLGSDFANQNWVMTNNVLAGGSDGSGGAGAGIYSFQMVWENNSYFAVLPGWVDARMAAPVAPPNSQNIFGNTHVQTTTLPVITGRGVDYSMLPNDCAVITGNRKDIACQTGQ